jgi:flagellar secretion chaperone FliS
MKNALEAKLTYRENAVRGATPIELVVILFDSALDDMRRAASAARASDIEERAAAIRHAMLVLQQLQGTLDFEKGGQVARQFEQFYNLVRAKLLEAQLRNSPELMQQQIQFMSEVRDCWAEAEKQLSPRPSASAVTPAPTAQGSLEDGGPTSTWSA